MSAVTKTAALYPYADQHLSPVSPCRACGKPIFFGKTINGHNVPLDPVPNPAGNYVRNGDRSKPTAGARAQQFAVVKQDEPVKGPRYLSHFATCSDPQRFRADGSRR